MALATGHVQSPFPLISSQFLPCFDGSAFFLSNSYLPFRLSVNLEAVMCKFTWTGYFVSF